MGKWTVTETSSSDPFHDITTFCSCVVDAVPTGAGAVTVVGVGGEVDLYSIGGLDELLRHALADRPRHLVVDLGAVTFCDVRGIRLFTQLVPAHAAAVDAGFTLTAVPEHTAAFIAQIDKSRPDRHPTAAEALADLVPADAPAVTQVLESLAAHRHHCLG